MGATLSSGTSLITLYACPLGMLWSLHSSAKWVIVLWEWHNASWTKHPEAALGEGCHWWEERLEAGRSGMVMICNVVIPFYRTKVFLPSRIPGAGREGSLEPSLTTRCKQGLPSPLFKLLGRKLHLQWEMRSAGWRETLPGSLLNPIIYISLNPIKLATYHIKMAKERLCQAVLIQ